jgi:methionyl-tRNA formyltransferase
MPLMDIVFCGTPQFAVPALRALLDAPDFNVRLVVCQPDRPSGRGLQLTAPPVKQLALERGVTVTQPEIIKNNEEFRAALEAIRPEVIVVVAYGRIIPRWMLDLPPLGNINLHASLLPKYRGAAPIQWAIAMGETVTGNTTIRLDEGLDTGDILLARELAIDPEDTAETLAPKLAEQGAPLLLETLRGLKPGTITPQPQDHRQATLAPLLKKEDGLIDFGRTAIDIANRLRGFSPWPGSYTQFRAKPLNVWKARPAPANSANIPPGQLRLQGEHLYVGCGGNTALELLEVQPQGKKRMTARDFVNGYRPKPGETLGSCDL